MMNGAPLRTSWVKAPTIIASASAWAIDAAVVTGPIAPPRMKGETMSPWLAPQYTWAASVTTRSTSSGELVLTLPMMTQLSSMKSAPWRMRAMSTLSSARDFSVMAPRCGLSPHFMCAYTMSRWRFDTGTSQGSTMTNAWWCRLGSCETSLIRFSKSSMVP